MGQGAPEGGGDVFPGSLPDLRHDAEHEPHQPFEAGRQLAAHLAATSGFDGCREVLHRRILANPALDERDAHPAADLVRASSPPQHVEHLAGGQQRVAVDAADHDRAEHVPYHDDASRQIDTCRQRRRRRDDAQPALPEGVLDQEPDGTRKPGVVVRNALGEELHHVLGLGVLVEDGAGQPDEFAASFSRHGLVHGGSELPGGAFGGGPARAEHQCLLARAAGFKGMVQTGSEVVHDLARELQGHGLILDAPPDERHAEPGGQVLGVVDHRG